MYNKNEVYCQACGTTRKKGEPHVCSAAFRKMEPTSDQGVNHVLRDATAHVPNQNDGVITITDSEIRKIISEKIEMYRAKQSKHNPLANDNQNQWDAIGHTIEALEYLSTEIDAALGHSPFTMRSGLIPIRHNTG